MRKLVDKRKMTEADWQAYRGQQKGIGGSEIASVIGVNPYKPKFKLWLEKTGQIPVEALDNEFIKWGNILEPVIRKQFAKETGFKVFQNNFVLQHDEWDHVLANIDGEVIDPAYEGRGVLEIKTTSEYNLKEWQGDKLPIQYMAQVQWYMATTQYTYAYVVVLIGGNKLRWWVVERDEAIIEQLIHASNDFMELVRTMTPPEIGGSKEESDYVNSRFDQVVDEEMSIPPIIENLAIEYTDIQQEMNRLKERSEEIKNQIKLEAKDFKTLKGESVRISLSLVNKTLFDSKTFQKEHNELYEKYKTKTSSYRDFRVKLLEEKV
jgi:putative phage-type endonuclease